LWWGFESVHKFTKYIENNDFDEGHILLLSFEYSGTKYLMVAEIEDGETVNPKLEFKNVNLVDQTDNSQIIKDIKANALNYKLGNFAPANQTTPIIGEHKGNLKLDNNVWKLDLKKTPFDGGKEIKFIKTNPLERTVVDGTIQSYCYIVNKYDTGKKNRIYFLKT
jgi:hypothetical protein